MNAGDVELSGAVDFNPDELEDKPKTQEIKQADETVETANRVASVKEEDIRFYSDEIKKNHDMFVRVEGSERRKRAEERRKKIEQKQSLREAERADRINKNQASRAVVESEKQLKKEQRQIAREQRAQRNNERRAKVLAWAKKHWYIFVAVVVLVIVSCIVFGIIGSKLAEEAKMDDMIRKANNLTADVKAIEKRMWENSDGGQPWTAIREYDEMIPKLSTGELKADAYISRSRMLLNYVQTYETDDKDELMRIIKSDVEKAVEFNVSDRAVCWASKLGKTIGDLDLYNKYTKECEEWDLKNPQSEQMTPQNEHVDGEREEG